MKNLAGKVIAITGAAQGLGRATALAMGREGARLALTDIDAAGLASTMDSLHAEGVEAVSVVGDVTQAATHDQLLASALGQFGSLHGLCNVAGVLGAGQLADITEKSFDHVMHVNCFAQLLAIQRMASALKASGSGAIVLPIRQKLHRRWCFWSVMPVHSARVRCFRQMAAIPPGDGVSVAS
jgi:NAD(P)-dependent dehydrogenase (short-subunit alcohol dehydrogenase family)